MDFDKKYLDACKKDVHDLTKIRPAYWQEPRYKILKRFCENEKDILSVGCGPKEPLITNASHAMDIIPNSVNWLKKAGWKGDFRIGSCTKIPFLDKEFNIVVCSEVIEHLPTIADVIQTFKEVARVGKRWIITTPNSARIKPINQNPAHLQFFTIDKIKEIIPVKAKIYLNDHHIYMESS